jgi:hypothetical protein
MKLIRCVFLPAAAALLLLACEQAPPRTAAPNGPPAAAPSEAPKSTATAPVASSGQSNPCEAKVPGIELKAVGLWVPKWDDAAGCEWSKEGEFWGIHVRYFPNSLDSKDKLANIDDLKSAAPMMTEIGTAVTKVIRPSKKTANGWFTVVESNEGQSQNFIYVQALGSKTLVCSATVKSANDMGGVPVEDALAACESIKPKP